MNSTFRTNIGMAESDMHELCHFAPKKYLPTISEVCFFQSQGKMCKIETLRFLLFSEPMVLNDSVRRLQCENTQMCLSSSRVDDRYQE